MATDEKEATDLDFLERNDGVIIVFGDVLSRVVPRDRVEDEKTHHDRDAQGRQLRTGLNGMWENVKRNCVFVLADKLKPLL